MKSRLSTPITPDFTMRAASLASCLIPRLLLVCSLMLLAGSARAQGFNYTTYNGTVTITGYTGPGGAVTIPDTIANFPVVSIAPSAFQGNASITSLTISTNVMNIGGDAFEGCVNLASVVIPAGVTSIGDFAFSDTGLTTVTIPATVMSLGNGVFDECFSLGAINVAAGNANYSSVGGVLFDHGKITLIQCPPAISGSFAIPNTVITIDSEAFNGCINLTSVTIPNSVTTIGDFAFNNSGLTGVTIPSGLTSLGSHVFAFCSSLTNVTVPNNITSIGTAAFLYCTSLTNATIGSGVTTLGSYAFGNCTSLVSVYFNGNAPGADTTVFSGDSNLLIYFPAHASGWGPTFATIPTWYPLMQNARIQANQFSFNITGNSNIAFIVQACTNLANPNWISLQTNNLSGGAVSFTDPTSGSFPRRFYRLHGP